MLPSCIILSLLYCGPFGAVANHLALLFSVAAKHLEYVRSYQCSEIDKTETSLLGSPCKRWNIGHMHAAHKSFPSWGESRTREFSSTHSRLS